jgi:hypothetical protein
LLRLRSRIDPTGLGQIVQAIRSLVIDLREKAGQAAERGLDVAARAAKPVVKIDVAEGGIEVIPVHQLNRPTAEPNTFGVAGRTVDGAGSFGELVSSLLVLALGGFLGGVGGLGGGLALIGRRRSALGGDATETGEKEKGGDGQGGGELPQDRIS